MKKISLIITLILIISLLGVFSSFKTDQKETTEYMTICSQGWQNLNVFVSINGLEYKTMNYPAKGPDKGQLNYCPVLRLIQDYEKEGWEVVSNNFMIYADLPYNYFFLKRKK